MNLQLLLPIRPPRAPARIAKAKRDFSQIAFARALVRNGFRQLAGGGLKFADTGTRRLFDGATRINRNGIRVLRRRATIAKLIHERREIEPQ